TAAGGAVGRTLRRAGQPENRRDGGGAQSAQLPGLRQHSQGTRRRRRDRRKHQGWSALAEEVAARFPPRIKRTMKTLEQYLLDAERAHGHLCAGQVLGVRMAMLGLEMLGITDPTGADRKRLVTFVEIDRCATDAIGVVTGCRLGKRALKFRDWGKMAATFIDVTNGRAIRIAAKESSKQRARELYPDLEKNPEQMKAYRELPDNE